MSSPAKPALVIARCPKCGYKDPGLELLNTAEFFCPECKRWTRPVQPRMQKSLFKR